MSVLAISVLLLLVFALLSSSRPPRLQVVYVVERSSRPNGCLILVALAIITLFAVSR